MAMANKQLFTLERRLLAKRGRLSENEQPAVGANLNDVMGAIEKLRISLEKQQASSPVLANRDLLRAQLEEMRHAITMTKREIAAIRHPKADAPDRLEAASMELSAIVEATEEATHGILNAAEHIGDLCEGLRGHDLDPVAVGMVEQMLVLTTDIFEKCNFQDITGQRIGKVTRTLGYLEGRIETMIDIWGREGFDDVEANNDLLDEREDAHLLEGPQQENEGVTQDMIDSLFD